jgi:hypothetical protein
MLPIFLYKPNKVHPCLGNGFVAWLSRKQMKRSESVIQNDGRKYIVVAANVSRHISRSNKICSMGQWKLNARL